MIKKIINKLNIHSKNNIKKILIKIKLFLEFYYRLCFQSHHVNKKKYPTILQLPITYKCNFDCVMCGMHKLINKKGFTTEELSTILTSKLFNKINSVGVNGGEPFLLNNIEEYVEVIIKCLPKLKKIFIISNGYFTKKIIDKLQLIYKKCKENKIELNFSVSIDGINQMQDLMRGKNGAFHHVCETCKEIITNKNKYCDNFGAICTITKINIFNLQELIVWASNINLPISFNIATIHERIENEEKYDDFSVFTDEYIRKLAEEFFYTLYLKTKKKNYFALYYYIRYYKRIATCEHKFESVTITPDGGISYCATFSKEIGNTLSNNANDIYWSKNNIKYRNKLHLLKCTNCSHYTNNLTLFGQKEYIKEEKRRLAVYR